MSVQRHILSNILAASVFIRVRPIKRPSGHDLGSQAGPGSLTWNVELKPAQSMTTSGPLGGSSFTSSSATLAGLKEGGVSSVAPTPSCIIIHLNPIPLPCPGSDTSSMQAEDTAGKAQAPAFSHAGYQIWHGSWI